MTNVSEWSVTAGLNNSSPPDGWPEGMARSAVNDCAREMMAALARWYKDQIGVLQTAGTGNAYTLTTNNSYASLDDLPLLAFRTNRANTGSITLNVDGLGALTVYRNAGGPYDTFASGDLFNGQIMVVSYNRGGWFDYIGPSVDSIDAGTLMLFQQTAAPTGWVKVTTHNNKALRVVSGTASFGGSTGFSSVFTSRIIAQANLPIVNFSGSMSGSISGSTGTVVLSGTIGNFQRSGAGDPYISALSSGASAVSGSASVSGSVSSGGSGTALDFSVQYVDVIIATKA